MVIARTGRPVQVLAENAPSGLVGTITVQAYDPADASVLIAVTSSGITEPRPGTYRAQITPPRAGEFRIRWTAGDAVAEEPLEVHAPHAPVTVTRTRPGRVLSASVGHIV